jgi:hypothetical protein
MSEFEKGAAFKVSIDLGDFKKTQEDLQARINDIRNEQLKLDVSTKENQKTFAENNRTLKALEQQQKLNQKALNDLTQAEKANTDTTNFNNNSIKQNRELLKELNAEYIRIQKPTQEQTNRLKNLTDVLKAQESAIGNNTRNVGNYREAFQGVLQSLPGISKGLGDVTNGFRAVSMANPFTALILILPPIITYLQKFETVFDAIENVVAGAGGAIRGIVANFEKLLTLDFKGFADGVGNAAKESFQLSKATQDLEDSERALSVEYARSEAQVKNLIIQSKDRTKTEKERLALLDEASRIEEANFNKALQLSKEKLRIEQETLKQAEKAGTANDALRDRVANAEREAIQLASSSADLQEKIQNRRNALLDENIANQEKAAAKQLEIEKKITAEKIAEVEKRVKIETERLEQLRQFRAIVQEQENQQRIEEAQRAEEDYQKEIEQRQRDFELFLDNEILRADTAEDIRGAEIEKLKALNAQAVANTKLSEEQKTNIILKNNKAIVAIERQATQERIQQLNALGATFTEASQLLGQSTQAGKTLAIASTIISTYQAAQQAFAALAGIPGVGPALGAAASAVAIASGLARVRAITSVEVPGFAQGGLSGKRITRGDGAPIRRSNGDNILATVKTGEVILNERQQSALGGPATFARIGVPGFADGGIAQAARSTEIIDSGQGAIVDAIRAMRVVVSVEEITRVSNQLQIQTEIAEL